jgi:hypothetical protein
MTTPDDDPRHDLARERYKRAGAEFRRLVDLWDHSGMPQSGPLFEEMGSARAEYIAADQAYHDVCH